jgi:predicted acylesterase/phospholipase RssA
MKPLVCSLLVSLAAGASDGKCRVLGMRGGGIHGAFEVGVLKAFTDNLSPIDYRYDVISGVSVGALNTGLLSVFDYGQEKQAVEFLENFYKTNLA